MADITVSIPGVGDVDFPDSMSEQDINAAAKRLHDQANPAPNRDPLAALSKATAIGSMEGKNTGDFLPGPREFIRRAGAAAVDVPVGMVKTAGRLVQAIPGVTAATDALYGLPEGSSARAMQPTNTNERIGGYLGDLALSRGVLRSGIGATGQAVINRGVQTGARVLRSAAEELSPAGLSPERIGQAIATYGKRAVADALIGAGLYGAYKHLIE